MSSYASGQGYSASEAAPSERAEFIRKTYLHLAGAILACIGVVAALLQTDLGLAMATWIVGGKYNWLMFLGAFGLSGWLARGMAHGSQSMAMQYLALGIYVVAEALLFLPMIYIAVSYSSPSIVPIAGLMTLTLFGGLTLTAFTSGTDFSFLRGFLTIGAVVALGLIVYATIFGVDLGLLFSGGMAIFAMAAILYDTSKVLRTFPTDRHVGAALELFASIALLFWYVLRILMRLNSRR